MSQNIYFSIFGQQKIYLKYFGFVAPISRAAAFKKI